MKDLYLMQMREMAKVVYDAGLNIDYFPTNFIVQDEQIFILIMNVTIIWMNGILKIGELSTGLRHKNLLIIWNNISYTN